MCGVIPCMSFCMVDVLSGVVACSTLFCCVRTCVDSVVKSCIAVDSSLSAGKYRLPAYFPSSNSRIYVVGRVVLESKMLFQAVSHKFHMSQNTCIPEVH